METLNQYADDPNELAAVPTGMENDPNADEEVIDQHSEETTTSEPAAPRLGGEMGPEYDLASSIAYALDGSGPGISENPPLLPPSEHKVISEGITGAGPEDEEAALTNTLTE